MEYLKPETTAAIAADEFARKTIEATRAFIYSEHRDWSVVSRRGNIVFDTEDAAIAYHALSALLGTDEVPDLGRDAKVNIGGGGYMSVDALNALTDAMKPARVAPALPTG